ncbi:hypothetical protein BraRD5C2_64270 [Bradyrhizobium sp. RD5-C2]|nr:hypothetical protein BraRD5C2_64270 [Bradyrhizobium sp. RD5-C2]
MICVTVPNAPAVKSRPDAWEHHAGNAMEAMRQARELRTAWNVAVLDENDRDLSSGLRLSPTTAPDAQFPM